MEINQIQLEKLHSKIDNLTDKVNDILIDVERIKVLDPKETYDRIMKILYVFGGVVMALSFFGITNIEKITKVEETRKEIQELKDLTISENTKLREHIILLQNRINQYENGK